jgi:hypothetical protein
VDGILNGFLSGAGVVLPMLVDPHSNFDDKPSQGHGISPFFDFSSAYQKIGDKSRKNEEKLANSLKSTVI